MKPTIAFTGGHGSGKTTVAKHIIEFFNYDYCYINQTRKLIVDTYEGNLRKAREENIKFQNSLLSNKIDWEIKHKEKGFVTDRTTIDNLAYFMLYSNSEEITYKEFIDYYDKALYHAASCYDFIFCLSPIYNTPYDVLSPSNTLDKAKVYYTILGLLSHVEFTHKIYHIETLDRIQKVTSVLEAYYRLQGIKKD